MSQNQLFITEQHAHPIHDGPALLFSSLLPDMHHHSGRGGRVFPLYRDLDGQEPNLSPGLLTYLQRALHLDLTPHDLIAYIAGLLASRCFTRRFQAELQAPGVRLPITTNPELWSEAVQIGHAVISLHTFGDRGSAQLEMLNLGIARPMVEVAIPDTEDSMPTRIFYEPSTRTLRVGSGQIRPVSQDAWEYQVAGMPVVKHWFGYRKCSPAGVRSSELDSIVATRWTPALTTELLEVLCTLETCLALEASQQQLLEKVLQSPLVTTSSLGEAGVLPPPTAATKPPKFRSPGTTL